MGVIIPQVLTEDRVSGAQIVDGSLRFDRVYFIDGQALDPSYFGYTDALTNTWRPKKYNQLTVLDTYSAGVALTATTYADIGGSNCTITNNGSVTSSSAGTNSFGLTNAADMTGAQRVDINMGNVSSTFFQSAWTLEIFFKTSNTSDGNWFVGTAQDGSTWQTGWAIQYQSGSLQWAYDSPAGGSLKSLGIALSSKWFLPNLTLAIDGLRDSTAPIGQDQSGRGNNWTPVNFGGSNTLEKATGALPILNTDGGGKVARVGVRTDSSASSLVLALPLVGIKSDFSNAINSGTSNKASAVAFDGSGDYLSLADNADFAFGTGDFTAECFIYPTANASYQAIIDCRDAVTQATGWILGVDANDNIYIYNNGFLLQSGSNATPENRWYHVAYVRNSGTHALYVDGRSVATSSSSYDYTVDNCVIGASYAKNSEYWDGFISNVRLVKGTALYTSNFTPPSAPLTSVENTKLLCCQSNTSAGAAAVSPNLGGINDGRVWSDASNLANPGLLFDGNDDTFVNSSDTSGGNLITSATQFTVPEGQTLTIRTQNGGASNISVNGSNVATSSGNVVTTLVTGGVGGTLVTSITAPTGFNLYYLKVNGVALMDPVAPNRKRSSNQLQSFYCEY
jgi:hypothetical protein